MLIISCLPANFEMIKTLMNSDPKNQCNENSN